MNKILIKCTGCGIDISVDQALASQLQRELENKFAQEMKIELASKIAETEAQFEKEKQKIILEQAKKIEAESKEKLKFLEDELKRQRDRAEQAEKAELEIRKLKNEIEEEKRAFELEKQRQLDMERENIRQQAMKMAEAEFRLKEAEYAKQIQDARKAQEELKRKLDQGSQQTQGEVLELELENILKQSFPFDEILPVAKGVNGADILQCVRDRQGRNCGQIIWEFKSTKAWSMLWVTKLKDDQRQAKAEIAVIVSKVLPDGISTFGYHDGIWVSNFDSAIPLAFVLRHNLMSLMSIKAASIGKNEKMEVIYNYLAGTEFRQRIEAIVESFTAMKKDLETEKRSLQKIWAVREKQIERIIQSTIGIYGDLQGISGNSIQHIPLLELPVDDEPDDKPIPSGTLFA